MNPIAHGIPGVKLVGLKLIGVVLSGALVAACAGGGEVSSSNPPASAPAEVWTPANPAMMKAVDELVLESLDVGAIKSLDVDAHEVRVNPVAWTTWDAAAKQDFTATVAIYCDQHGSVHGRYVDVVDDATGKKVAHYGPSGLEIF